MRWYQRLFCRERTEKQLDAELRFHLEQQIADYVAAGMTPEEARRRTRLEFGGLDQVKEECRDVGAARFVESLIQDVRYGLRQLRRNPGFTAVAVITLALGIGANTAIFSLLDAVMLRPLPVRDPSQLVMLRWSAHHFPQNKNYFSFGDCAYSFTGTSGCNFPLPVSKEIQLQTKLFSGIAGFAGSLDFPLSGNGTPALASGELVSGSYFSMLGVRPTLGRLIGPGDDTPSSHPVVDLSFAYWQRAFGGSKSAIGRTIVLGKVPFTIIGVAPPNFTGISPGKTQDVWLPIAPSQQLAGNRWGPDWAADAKRADLVGSTGGSP
jgi:hypothetical protein